jgi:iron complex transport system substrate-binding protein
MRICSFLPSTTEIICELGLVDDLIGITHECDFPETVNNKERVIMSSIDHKSLSSKEIDDLVTENSKNGKSTYLVDKDKLKAANPDIIFTQGLCEVCAVSGNQVLEAAQVLENRPEIISLEPGTVDEVLESIVTIGNATGKSEQAGKLVVSLKKRIDIIRNVSVRERDKPRVFCLEWLEPPFVAGHWVPEMVEIAGGENGLRNKGEPSIKVEWEEILDFAPHYIFVIPCGFDIDKTLNEIDTVTSNSIWHQTPASQKGNVYLVDANSYFSRPGPRIVDGIEIIARTIHPDLFKMEPPPGSILNLRNYMQIQAVLG